MLLALPGIAQGQTFEAIAIKVNGSVNPNDSTDIQGGTQDNGTFETHGSVKTWPQTIYGDGGLNGFDATDPHFRLHTYFGQQPEVSFHDGIPSSWDFGASGSSIA